MSQNIDIKKCELCDNQADYYHGLILHIETNRCRDCTPIDERLPTSSLPENVKLRVH